MAGVDPEPPVAFLPIRRSRAWRIAADAAREKRIKPVGDKNRLARAAGFRGHEGEERVEMLGLFRPARGTRA